MVDMCGEGWGFIYDGNSLIYSDGLFWICFFDLDMFEI